MTSQTLPENGHLHRNRIVWAGGHYFGLNRHPHVLTRTKAALDKYGTGAAFMGDSDSANLHHRNLQNRLASLLGKDAAHLYATYAACNLIAISGAVRAGIKLALLDREAPASVYEGCRLAGATIWQFEHNCLIDFEEKLANARSSGYEALVAIEAISSMSGDETPLLEIVQLKRKYPFLLIVDEAHSFGLYGPRGTGRCRELGIEDDADLITIALSNAIASVGGVLAVNRAHGFLHMNPPCGLQTSVTAVDVATINACLDVLASEAEHIWSLREKSSYFRMRLQEVGFRVRTSRSPMVPIEVEDARKGAAIRDELLDRGIFVETISQTESANLHARLYFVVTSVHTYDEIDYTIGVLADVGARYFFLPSRT